MLFKQGLCLLTALLLAVPFYVNATEEVVTESSDVEDEYTYSEAETYVFFNEHLKNITETGELTYEFHKTGSLEEGFTDKVILKIKTINENGNKFADIKFFSGDRSQYVAPNTNTNINGVLLVFLQGDVYEMDRLTDGVWRYFHRRVKHAFHEAATVEDVKFDYNGKEVSGKKITMAPFLNDVHRADFEDYAEKRYHFYFSEEVPGMLYKIQTIVPDMTKKEKAFEEPLLLETLILVDTTY